MKPRLLKFLAIFGAISFVGVGALALSVADQLGLGSGNHAKTDQASTQDVRFILKSCKVDDSRTERVLHSFVSERSFTNDYFDIYVIKIKNLTLADMKSPSSASDGGWTRCDQLNPATSGAVRWITKFADYPGSKWCPKAENLLSDKFYAWVLGNYLPTEALLIFANPSEGVIYYVAGKT